MAFFCFNFCTSQVLPCTSQCTLCTYSASFLIPVASFNLFALPTFSPKSLSPKIYAVFNDVDFHSISTILTSLWDNPTSSNLGINFSPFWGSSHNPFPPIQIASKWVGKKFMKNNFQNLDFNTIASYLSVRWIKTYSLVI